MRFTKKTVKALIIKELKDYYRNPIVLIILFLPTFFTIFYSNIFNDPSLKINICINSGIIFSGLFLPPYLITEEKDNRTLDALILFSVHSYEFLVGKLLHCLFFSLLSNMLSLFAFKLKFTTFLQIAILMFISLVGIILIGTLIGLMCRNQPEAMICSIIIISLLYMIPIVENINVVTSKILLLLGISNMDLVIKNIINGKGLFYSGFSLLVMVVWVIVPVFIFSHIYGSKKLE